MIVLGDISGIQSYLFDVAEAGGGQARRLRARSFFIQLLAEAAALRVLRALEWPIDSEHFVLSGAGKFLLRGPSSLQIDKELESVEREMTAWLLKEARGELRLSLAAAEADVLEAAAYIAALTTMERKKLRNWSPRQAQSWDPTSLVLDPLDQPCALCGHAKAVKDETDSDTGNPRKVCARCAADREMGRRLPLAKWLVISNPPTQSDYQAFDLGFSLSAESVFEIAPRTVAVVNLVNPEDRPAWCPPDLFLNRRLVAYIPTENRQPVWFTDLAKRSRGDRLLAVLKADVDWLGRAFSQLLSSNTELTPVSRFSDELDAFFSGQLKREMEAGSDSRRRSIYTIFSGGDDLLLIGPWDVMADFAGRVQELFDQKFGSRGLTLSAGMALIKPKRPVKNAVAEAATLLEQAKAGGGLGTEGKNRFAGFGQVWKWEHHETILKCARQLTDWVTQGKAQRGWLHTLLQLAEARRGDPERGKHPDLLATSRLAYHVSRNYTPNSDIRRWGDRLMERFDNLDDPEVHYLPATLRYALTATRAPREED